MQYRPPTGSIPHAPGSYQFYDSEGRVLYVGKAKSLRHRLPNYWQESAKLMPRTAQMVAQADHVEWIVVDSEVDTLILEHSLIQAHLPRYNVRLKDDKSYPWLAITLNEEWPRPAVVHGRKRKGVRCFGPYGRASPSADPLDLLIRSFPVRTCSETKFKRHERFGAAMPALRHRPLLWSVRGRSGSRGLRRLRQRPDAVPLRRHRAVLAGLEAESARRRTSSSSTGGTPA